MMQIWKRITMYSFIISILYLAFLGMCVVTGDYKISASLIIAVAVMMNVSEDQDD